MDLGALAFTNIASSHFLSTFSLAERTGLSLKMGGLKADANCPLLHDAVLIEYSSQTSWSLSPGSLYVQITGSQPSDSVSGGFEWHLKMGISPSGQVMLGGWGSTL